MSYSLSVYGHCDNPDQEKTLAQSIGKVLKDAGPIVATASFSGSAVNGDPRDLVTDE